MSVSVEDKPQSLGETLKKPLGVIATLVIGCALHRALFGGWPKRERLEEAGVTILLTICLIVLLVLHWNRRRVLDLLARATFGWLVRGARAYFDRLHAQASGLPRNNVGAVEQTVFRKWAAEHPTLARWLADQIRIAQDQYAFSLTCVVVRRPEEGADLEFLLVRRKFQGFTDEVLLPPGGRFHAASGTSLLEELQNTILTETGVLVSIIASGPPETSMAKGAQLSTSDHWETVGPDSGKMMNEVYSAPLLVMKQNRQQSNGVPGHIDLVYLGFPNGDGSSPLPKAEWISSSALDGSNHDKKVLWPDTRKCLKRAAAHFEAHEQRGRFSPAAAAATVSIEGKS